MSEQRPLPVILIDDEKSIRTASSQTLQLAGYQVKALESAEPALADVSFDWPGVLVTDINMPGIDGLELLERVQAIDPDLPVILITGHGDISMAVNAIRGGAYDFIEKPFPADLLTDVVRRAMEKRALTIENRNLRQELQAQSAPGPRIIGKSLPLQRMRQLLAQVANTPADILIMGETGTGKDLVARYIHENSDRKDRNFVAINCGGVPENLMESELFGHEKGAFTDAKSQRVGKLEHAQGGTLFLDEIESMPVSLQIKLLRVLEERCIERLGSNEQIPLDIRIIAASKADLREQSDAGNFREDLYYRLNVVRVDIPPLRERAEDIPLLFQHFALIASTQYQREVPALSPERVHSLVSYDWPGNVRELRNVAERYVLLGEGCTFEFDQLIPQLEAASALTLPEKVERFEKMLIEEELARCRGSIKETLINLGLPRKTLYDKMRKYHLDKRDFKG
ncbi:sigma-54 dependent transcriptional regulator [Motiliproteus sp. SC1-56]|uniref:sigma-54-dependent transcriptional regulator n=1 Tax=Motiliproteus sp. SC1-56 TaxID=2799565 RepID=UPI001A8D53AD|nr:sigma-54 dependent transcriptional regulator [Motiliproteus sp. SC1-56]